jgi:hypothetical protein
VGADAGGARGHPRTGANRPLALSGSCTYLAFTFTLHLGCGTCSHEAVGSMHLPWPGRGWRCTKATQQDVRRAAPSWQQQQPVAGAQPAFEWRSSLLIDQAGARH